MPDARAAEDLREFLRHHSVAGYEVTVPIFGPAVIDYQTPSPGGGFVYYRVVADKPIPFHEFAGQLGIDEKPMTLEEWRERFVAGATKSLPPLPADMQDTLEAGGRVSYRDFVFRDMMARGCLDLEMNVTCYTFESRHVVMRVLRKGQAVEVRDAGGPACCPGRVVGLEQGRKIALIELFAPVTFMQTPQSIVPEAIRKGYHSETVHVLGYGVIDGFEEQKEDVPPGTWDAARREYTLAEPMPLSRIRGFCGKHYPEEPFCVYQAMTMFILPVSIEKAEIVPLPEGTDPEEVVVEMEEG